MKAPLGVVFILLIAVFLGGGFPARGEFCVPGVFAEKLKKKLHGEKGKPAYVSAARLLKATLKEKRNKVYAKDYSHKAVVALEGIVPIAAQGKSRIVLSKALVASYFSGTKFDPNDEGFLAAQRILITTLPNSQKTASRAAAIANSIIKSSEDKGGLAESERVHLVNYVNNFVYGTFGLNPPPAITYSLIPADSTFVFEGDSITALRPSWPAYLERLSAFAGKGDFYTVANAGWGFDLIEMQYSKAVFPHRPSALSKNAYLFLRTGANDIAAMADATAWWNWVKAYLARARADGFKIICFTVQPRADVTNKESMRRDLNALIRKDSTAWDYLVDVDAMFPDAADSKWYSDGVHPTEAQAITVARAVDRMFSSDGLQTSRK